MLEMLQVFVAATMLSSHEKKTSQEDGFGNWSQGPTSKDKKSLCVQGTLPQAGITV